ncbi:hypothetical protein ACFE04_019448 [Oxalis oulophora]
MSKLRNIILFLFGTHRLKPRPHDSGPNVAPIYLYRPKIHHGGASSPSRRAVRRLRRAKKGRGDAAFDDSSTDDNFKSAKSGREDITTPAGSQRKPSKSTDSDDEDDNLDDFEEEMDEEMDAAWSSTTTTNQPSSTNVDWSSTSGPFNVDWSSTNQPDNVDWGSTNQPSTNADWSSTTTTNQPSSTNVDWSSTNQPSNVDWSSTNQPSNVDWRSTNQPYEDGSSTNQPFSTNADWSSTTNPSSSPDPYLHYRQEEGLTTVNPSTTQGTPSTQTYPPSTTPSTIDWYIDPHKGPRLFPPRTFTTTTQPPKSIAEFFARSPKIPIHHTATSTRRQTQMQQIKKQLHSFSSVVKPRQIPVKYPWPVITSRDWREMNGIRVWADRFEKDEYIVEDGKPVKKYESKRWKRFVHDIKLSVDRLAQVTKIHMPLPLPDFVIDMMEEGLD